MTPVIGFWFFFVSSHISAFIISESYHFDIRIVYGKIQCGLKEISFWYENWPFDFCGFCVGPMKAEEVDPRLLIPVCDRLCCYLPWSVRRHFYCGAEYQTEVSTAHMYMYMWSVPAVRKMYLFFQPHSGCTSRTPKFPQYDNLYSILKFLLNATIILYHFLYF